MTTQTARPLAPRRSSNSTPLTMRGARLQKHADYQRVYKSSRKHFSPTMAYFFSVRNLPSPVPEGPRVGLTAGKVLGNAVARNRIKRRMREAVRRHVSLLSANVDVILHPRRSAATAEFLRLENEVERIFVTIQQFLETASKRDSRPKSVSQPGKL